MPWSLQTVGSTIFYIPGGSNLPLAGAGTIATNNNGTIIMVGRGTNSIAAYDISGGTWSIPSTIFSTTGRSVAVGNGKYVAVGEGGKTFAITNDGTTWGTIASPPFSTAGYDIVYAGSTWVAVGTGTNSVAYFNGTSWISINNGVGRDYTSKNYTLRYTLNSDTVSGTRLLNDATGIYDASLVNGATINAFSKYGGGSLYVNNTGGWSAATTKHVLLPTIDISSSGFTVSLWIYPINTDSFVFEFKDGTSNGMLFQVVSDLTLRLYPNLGQGASFLQSSSTITVNQWTHCCITISSAQFISIYANGVLYASGTSPVNVFGTKSTSILGSSTLPNTSFNGYIDEFITYPRAISAAEVSNLYNSSSLSTGYGLYYDASVPRLWATGVGLNQIAYASAATGPWTGSSIPNMTQVNAIGSGSGSSSSSLWVAIGNNVLATSTNGQSWTSQTVTNFSTAGGFGSVYYANSMWMVIAGNGVSTTSNRIFTSSNATSWTASTTNRGGTFGQGIGYGPGNYSNVNTNIWVTGGGQGTGNTISTVQLSNDNGTNWYPVNSVGAAPINNRGLCVAFGKDGNGGNLWLVGGYAINPLGYKDRISEVNVNVTASSLNTVTGISTLFPQVTIAPSINGIAWGQHSSGSNLWVAVGNQGASGGGGNTIAYSRDGSTNWIGLGASVFTGYGWGVAFGKDEANVNLWVAVGQGGNSIAYSYDGSANWVGVTGSSSIFTTRGFAVAYSGGIWVAAGSGGNSLAYSTNGRSWTGITTNNPIGITGSGLGVYGTTTTTTTQLYVAGGIGTNNLQKSSDGTTWASVTSPFSIAVNDVKNNGTYWVAVGEGGNTIATSSDGTTWTGRGTATFSIRGNKVRWNATQNKWYAVGEGGNTLAASTDGTGSAWTGIVTTGYVDISGVGLAFN